MIEMSHAFQINKDILNVLQFDCFVRRVGDSGRRTTREERHGTLDRTGTSELSGRLENKTIHVKDQ